MTQRSLSLLICILIVQIGFASDVVFRTEERFHPEIGTDHMVSTQEFHATEIGEHVLANGGNAIDAAVAVGFALAVTLPRAGNLGGGGFMMFWDNQKKEAIALDYRESAPKAADVSLYLDEKGMPDPKKIHWSYLATGVPGTVKGLLTAHKRWGKLPLITLLKPAIGLAQFGFLVTPGLADAIRENEKPLKSDPATAKIFFKRNGNPYKVGERIRQRDLSMTLKLIAKYGEKAFYQGEIAKKIVKAMEANGGIITADDLKSYHVKFRKPLQIEYHGKTLYSMPPPSSGGVTLFEILKLLDKLDIEEHTPNTADYFHLIAEVANRAYNDRNAELGDPDFVEVPVERLLSTVHIDKTASQIDLARHTPAENISKVKHIDTESPQTTHFSIIDKEGNMVSNTYTLNYSFGNGHVVPGAGFLLNNELDDFTLKPGIPNSFGLVQGEKNLLGPGRRPLSSMTPVIIVNKNERPFLALGSPGGSRIITSVLQVILHVIDEELGIASAVAMPRIHSQLWPDELYVEQGISADTMRLLEQRGHQVRNTTAIGSVQVVSQQNNQFKGYADPRRQGARAAGK